MILVNNPGSWENVYPQLEHARWHGWTAADLVFPFFLFIMGVSLPLSFARRLAAGASRGELIWHCLKRSAVLFGLGLFIRAFPHFQDWQNLRFMGILTRIALVFLFACLAYLWLKPRGRWLLTALLLVGYWALLVYVPVPGYGAGNLTPEGNLGAYLDRILLGQHHLWQQRPWDPEGLLSTLPAIATALFGIVAGEWISSKRSEPRKVVGLVIASLLAVLAGLAWHQSFPINKNLWTSSYTLFTAGMAGLGLAAFYWLIEVKHWSAWSMPLVVYGQNAITLYVGSRLLTKVLLGFDIEESLPNQTDTTPVYTWLYEHLFASWAGPLTGSMAFAGSYALLWLGLLWFLRWRRIFLKLG